MCVIVRSRVARGGVRPREGDRSVTPLGASYYQGRTFFVTYGKNAMSAQMLEVSLLGVGTVLRLESGAWSVAHD